MTSLATRENMWKMVFVFINLCALGLAGWTIDSTTAWGLALEGFSLILAPLLAGALVIIGVLGTKIILDSPDEDTKTAGEADEFTDSPRDGLGGDTGPEESTPPESRLGFDDPGQELSGDDKQTSGDQTNSDKSTIAGDFAVEGYGQDANEGGDASGNPQPAVRETRAADTSGQRSRSNTATAVDKSQFNDSSGDGIEPASDDRSRSATPTSFDLNRTQINSSQSTESTVETGTTTDDEDNARGVPMRTRTIRYHLNRDPY
ncbi:hypothetical protein [Halobellus inordinatus]|uniref:hypothetical protein n=1 Tax=Halobellus inordinatus TaxID=1126236 RepID=UPI002114126B|nr:hypothetical protein [Halobellus ramosii]